MNANDGEKIQLKRFLPQRLKAAHFSTALTAGINACSTPVTPAVHPRGAKVSKGRKGKFTTEARRHGGNQKIMSPQMDADEQP
jgi:hypothetical protein